MSEVDAHLRTMLRKVIWKQWKTPQKRAWGLRKLGIGDDMAKLTSTDGPPYLIDPAAYYGHSMVDIAMSKLFGGFASPFYDACREVIPRWGNDRQQIELYQLYYLLVHLNLFGSGYHSGVSVILKKYF